MKVVPGRKKIYFRIDASNFSKQTRYNLHSRPTANARGSSKGT